MLEQSIIHKGISISDSKTKQSSRYDDKSCIITLVNRSNRKVKIVSNSTTKNLLTNKVQRTIDENGIAIFKFKKSIEDLDFMLE
jgi:hypothetical protein